MSTMSDDPDSPRVKELTDAGENLAHRLLEGPAATRWADLNSMLADIDRAREACRRILPLQKAEKPDADLIDMLWHYALMSYGRCFARSVRIVPQTEAVDELDEQGQKMHEFYIDVRDKFVAHSVNGLEQDMAAVALRNPSLGPPEFLAVTSVRVRAVPSGRNMVQGMLQQCYRVDRVLRSKITPLGQQLHAWAAAEPVQRLYALPPVLIRNEAHRVSERRSHPQFRAP